METTFILILVLAIIFTVYILVFAVWGAIEAPDYTQRRPFINISKTISEVVMLYIAPPVGIAFANDTCDTHPFENSSLPTAYTLWILFALAYFASRYFKKHLSPLISVSVSTLLIMGLAYCITLTIHFSSMAAGIVVPLFDLLLLAPLFCSIYLVKEIMRCNVYYRGYFETFSARPAGAMVLFYGWLSRNHLWLSAWLLAPLLLLIQAILYIAGQHQDSLISQFTESCGYLLSNKQDCSCGGDHYLCSVAANGDERLVKPVRFGTRKNEKILVNRQLLIANAFEQWLEDYTPKFHRIVRSTYDSMNIPVNAWSKHKRAANIIYIGMKPLEWLFLLWLYAFDKNPENRIARQYFPKKELQAYLDLHTHSQK